MANLNKVMLIGRLTRDPEVRTFGSGGSVAHFGFAVNNFKKNQQTGERIEEPVFITCDAFNGDFRKLADLVQKYLKKGSQAYLEGHLRLDQWDDKTTGAKRSMLKLVVDQIQLLDRREDGQGSQSGSNGGGYQRSAAPAQSGAPRQSAPEHDEGPMDESPPSGGDGDIPF